MSVSIVPATACSRVTTVEWRETQQLQIGNDIKLANGTWAPVLEIKFKGSGKVYNFTVGGNHNYFVGDLRLLTHNNCGNGLKFPNNADDMDNLLGFEGERIPDSLTTPGRNKVVWKTSDNVKITLEQHPYHPNALHIIKIFIGI